MRYQFVDFGVGDGTAGGLATGSSRIDLSDSIYASETHPESADWRGVERMMPHVPA